MAETRRLTTAARTLPGDARCPSGHRRTSDPLRVIGARGAERSTNDTRVGRRRSGFGELEQVAKLVGGDVVGVVDHDACSGGEVEGRDAVEDCASDDSSKRGSRNWFTTGSTSMRPRLA